jgi:hypothetical protein
MKKIGENYMGNIYFVERKNNVYDNGFLNETEARIGLSNTLVSDCVKGIGTMTTKMNKEISEKLLGEKNGGKGHGFIIR